MKGDWFPFIVFFGIIAIALFGGVKNAQQTPINQTTSIPTPEERIMTQQEISYQIQNTKQQTEALQKKVNQEQEAKLYSVYKGKITFSFGGYSGTDVSQEYIILDTTSNSSNPVNISGWTITSTSTGQIITIPQSTNLYSSNSYNGNENILVSPGERAYLVTGSSPIGYSFHTNICSGYLSQFNYFIPGLYTSCPLPRDEKDVIAIPRTQSNNNCFDLIDSLPACSVYTKTMDNSYSQQCQNFIQTKLNYQACVNTHKNDENFWSPKIWYIYLKREMVLWQPRRETLILKDALGKIVMKISR